MGRKQKLDPRYCLEVSKNQLIQTEDDKIFYNKLVYMINTLRNGLSASIASKANKELLRWIFDKTPNLVDTESFTYCLSTRIFWIRNGLIDFPHCVICGKQIGFQQQVKLIKGYPDHCSLSCAQHDPVVIQRKIESNIAAHGIEWWTNPDKKQKTLLATYGVDNYTKTAEYKVKQKEGFIRHYGVDNNMKCEEGRKEWSESYKARTGYDHNWKNPACRAEIKETLIDKYGTDHNMKCESGKEEWRQSMRNKYGPEYDHNWKVPEVRKQCHDTYRKNYGVDHPMQRPEIRKKSQTRYIYNNISFDSKPEIALFIWLTDNHIQFEYQPDCDLWYEYDGKKHKYYPDFIINSVIFEIKGLHMISENGSWICPWDRSKDGLYEAKHQCAVANSAVILTSDDYQPYLDYIDEKYGIGYLARFKNRTESAV